MSSAIPPGRGATVAPSTWGTGNTSNDAPVTESTSADRTKLHVSDSVARRVAISGARNEALDRNVAELKQVDNLHHDRLGQLEKNRETARNIMLIGGSVLSLVGIGCFTSGLGAAAGLTVAAAATGGIALGVGLIGILLCYLFARNGWLPLPGVDKERGELLADQERVRAQVLANQAKRKEDIERGDTRVPSALPPNMGLAPARSGVQTARAR